MCGPQGTVSLVQVYLINKVGLQQLSAHTLQHMMLRAPGSHTYSEERLARLCTQAAGDPFWSCGQMTLSGGTLIVVEPWQWHKRTLELPQPKRCDTCHHLLHPHLPTCTCGIVQLPKHKVYAKSYSL